MAAKLHVWDTVHYLRVAQCGYEDEQSHAFFPLLPGNINKETNCWCSWTCSIQGLMLSMPVQACCVRLLQVRHMLPSGFRPLAERE